jgi:hypothetical protein
VLTKFGFRIKTRGGMIVENLTVAARDRDEAERKVTQIYHHCEILECQELQQSVKEDGFSLDSAITLIGKETDPDKPAKE